MTYWSGNIKKGFHYKHSHRDIWIQQSKKKNARKLTVNNTAGAGWSWVRGRGDVRHSGFGRDCRGWKTISHMQTNSSLNENNSGLFDTVIIIRGQVCGSAKPMLCPSWASRGQCTVMSCGWKEVVIWLNLVHSFALLIYLKISINIM